MTDPTWGVVRGEHIHLACATPEEMTVTWMQFGGNTDRNCPRCGKPLTDPPRRTVIDEDTEIRAQGGDFMVLQVAADHGDAIAATPLPGKVTIDDNGLVNFHFGTDRYLVRPGDLDSALAAANGGDVA